MLSLSGKFNYYMCRDRVTLRLRHKGLREYIKSRLHHDPTNGDIYIFLSRDSHRVRLYYYHHQGEIMTEKIMSDGFFMTLEFDREKNVYHISWKSFVYLVEGIIPRDRSVRMDDIDDLEEEIAATSKNTQ